MLLIKKQAILCLSKKMLCNIIKKYIFTIKLIKTTIQSVIVTLKNKWVIEIQQRLMTQKL